ncbi:MAG: hypothetical protein INR73_17635 [Williamsia sp.]|nr:hypothetical protein [Williamsia sp.]
MFLSFGRGGKQSLKKGKNIFEFNSSGQIKGYPDSEQRLHSPFTLTIQDANNMDTPLLRQSVVYPPSSNTLIGGVTAKIKNGDQDSTKPGGVVKDSASKDPQGKDRLTTIPYYDAFALLECIDCKEIDIKQYAKILNYYNGSTNLEVTSLSEAYKGNMFLHSFIDSAMQSSKLLSGTNDFGTFLGKGFSAIGGLDVTTIADGLAKFVVKRAKQELSIAFFQKFKQTIDNTKDIATLVPETADILHAIEDETYNYHAYIQNLREAFKTDITSIHRNLPGIIENHREYFDKHKDKEAALRSACYLATELENQTHPGDIVANYPTEYLDNVNVNYKGAIQTMQMLSSSLRDTSKTDTANYWVSINQMRTLVNNKPAFKIYLGLLYQETLKKYDQIRFEKGSLLRCLDSVAKYYDDVQNVYNSYRNYILKYGEKLSELNRMVKKHGKQPSDSAVLELYTRYFRSSVDLIEYSTALSRLPVIKDFVPDLPVMLKPYFDVAYSAADLVAAINRKNYSSAINQTVHIYNVVVVGPARRDAPINSFSSSEKSQLKKLKKTDKYVTRIEGWTGGQLPDTVKSLLKGSLQDTIGVAQRISMQKQYDSSKKVLRNLVRYGSFMASVATATNSDDVAAAIETAALPVGSSRIKRASKFTVAVNAYPGLFYGIEKIHNIDTGKARFNVYGVTAPIGVAVSWGHRALVFSTGRHEWSTSIFVSLIDIGAVAAFRFRNDSVAQIPTIQLKDIFSPGVFLSVGIPKTPLSFNMGAQAGPNLRKVNVNAASKPGNDFNNKMYWRYSASLCVDIPVFNLFVSSEQPIL